MIFYELLLGAIAVAMAVAAIAILYKVVMSIWRDEV